MDLSNLKPAVGSKHSDSFRRGRGCLLYTSIKEVKRPDRDAQLVAENIAQQLENRISFRRAMKSAMGRTMKACLLYTSSQRWTAQATMAATRLEPRWNRRIGRIN